MTIILLIIGAILALAVLARCVRLVRDRRARQRRQKSYAELQERAMREVAASYDYLSFRTRQVPFSRDHDDAA